MLRHQLLRDGALNVSEVVDDSNFQRSAGGYFFANSRGKANVIIQDLQPFVGFSVMPKCMRDPEYDYFTLNSGWLFGVKFFARKGYLSAKLRVFTANPPAIEPPASSLDWSQ